MSQYLKDEKKEAVLEKIRKYMAYRMSNEEMLTNLKDAKFEISERTLRRYKLEIKQKSGKSITEIFQNEIVNNVIEDIFTFREVQYQSWKEYSKSNVTHERLKALSLIRNATLDKLKIYEQIPWKFRNKELNQNTKDIIDDTPGEEQKDLAN